MAAKPKKTNGHGGRRTPPGGRPIGAVGKLKRELRERGENPHSAYDHLNRILSNDTADSGRKDAAAALLLPFQKPRLSSTEYVHRSPYDSMSADERDVHGVGVMVSNLKRWKLTKPHLVEQIERELFGNVINGQAVECIDHLDS